VIHTLRTKLYNIRNDFNFSIVNSSFICSNIPTEPAYTVYIYIYIYMYVSQLIDIPELVATIMISLIEDCY
jgi:hypothetical protein